MREIGEAVDHGDRGVLGELVDLGLVERPDHQSREEPREHERGVAVGLAACELELGGREEERHAAELRDPDLERDPGPGRGLVEDQADRPTRQHTELGPSCALGLQLVGEAEKRLQLVVRPVGDAREVSSLELGRNPGHALMLQPTQTCVSSTEVL